MEYESIIRNFDWRTSAYNSLFNFGVSFLTWLSLGPIEDIVRKMSHINSLPLAFFGLTISIVAIYMAINTLMVGIIDALLTNWLIILLVDKKDN